MRGAPSTGAVLAGVGAAAGAGVASFWPQAERARAAPSARTIFRMRWTLGERGHVVTDGQRRGEAGALDAEQVDEAGNSVFRRRLDAKVRLRLAGPVQLRADAGVVRHQCA